MWSRSSAFLIWAAAAAAAVFWMLRLWGASPQPPAHAQPAPVALVARADLTRVLGADPVAQPVVAEAPAAAADHSRFQLLGVIAAGAGGGAAGPSRAAGSGWATISVDGKPARTYRVGSVVDGASVLQKVAARGVDIGPRGGAPAVTLKLNALPAAATGKVGGNAGNAANVGMAPSGPPAPATLPGGGPGVPSFGLPGAMPGNRPGAPGAAAPSAGPPPAGAEGLAAASSEANAAVPTVRRPGLATR